MRICNMTGCGLIHYGLGFCHLHYKRFKKYGDASAFLAKRNTVCTVAGCCSREFGRGFCAIHYKRWYTHDDPLVTLREPNGSRKKWCDEIALPFDSVSECVEFPFKPQANGYMLVHVGDRQIHAHFYICEVAHGERPTKTHQAAHSCLNKRCCNKKHLRWATPFENVSDTVNAGKHAHGETSGRAKLSAAQVVAIRQSDQSASILATANGVSARTIQDVKIRKTWRHL